MAGPSNVSTANWIRELFHDHPLLSTRDVRAYSKPDTKERPKVYCKQCWDRHIAAEMAADEAEIQEGRRIQPRDLAEIQDIRMLCLLHSVNGDITDWLIVWAYDIHDQRARWIQGRKETLLRHLRTKCPYQPAEVKDRAQEECLRIGILASPRRPQRLASHTQLPMQIQPFRASPSPLLLTPAFSSLSGSSSSAASSPLPFRPHTWSSLHSSPGSSVPPSPDTFSSAPESPNVVESSSRPAKRPRLSSRLSHQQIQHSYEHPVWSTTHQERFASRVARLTASCGFPFLWVDNPEWREFCAEFIPAAQPFGRKSLASHWIPEEVNKYRESAKDRSKGQEVTIQCDGWSGINSHHYVAFMITTARRDVCCLIISAHHIV